MVVDAVAPRNAIEALIRTGTTVSEVFVIEEACAAAFGSIHGIWLWSEQDRLGNRKEALWFGVFSGSGLGLLLCLRCWLGHLSP